MAERKGGRKKGSGKVYRGSARPSEEKWATFLATLAETGNVTASARAARITRETAYARRRDDPEFSRQWVAALDLGVDALEDELMRRAKDGVLKPVFQGGKKVGQVREYSDTLAILLVKAHRPERYRERTQTELTGGIKVERAHELTDDQLARIAAGSGQGAAEEAEGEK